MDETYIKIKGGWNYLYRAVDKDNNTIDFLLTEKRDKKAAKRFFVKAVENNGIELVRMIRKGQLKNKNDLRQTPAEIFYSLVV